ncbi:hypothetical protein H632_c323p0, partial [Helicosporidium sp. ATCC 50920]
MPPGFLQDYMLAQQRMKSRKQFLQQRKQFQPHCDVYRQHPDRPSGLLSLPEDVMLKIVCHLHHDEIKPLFAVCSQLRNTLREAVHLHFNFTTPYRASHEEVAGGLPRPDRAKKRSVTNLAAVLAHIGRNGRSLIPHLTSAATAPRTLHFCDAGSSPP